MILVTGATGTVGGYLVQQLCGQSHPVRALVRSQEKADSLRGYDCETAIGSYEDAPSLHRALEGVDRLFLLSAGGEQMAEQELVMVRAVQRAHAQVRVVKLAAAGVDGPGDSRFLRAHSTAIQALKEAGIATTVLAPSSFMQNFLMWAGSVQEQGSFFLPAGDAAISHVDARDVAAVAAHVLTSEGHEGATYTVTGPEAVTYQQVAQTLSSLLDKPVQYVDVPPAAAREAMTGGAVPEWVADGLLELFEIYRSGAAAGVTDEVHKATGRPARSVADFLHDHLSAYR